MKQCLLLFLFTGFFLLPAFSQQKQDTVYLGSQEVKDLITKNNYVRVPASDLDEILERKISREVSSRLTSSISIIGSVLGIITLLFGGFIASRQKERIKSLAADLKKEIKEEADKEIERRFNNLQKENELRFINSDTAVKTSIDHLDDKVYMQISDYLAKNYKEVIDPAIIKIQQEQQKAKDMQDELMRQTTELLKISNEVKIEKLQKNITEKRELQKTFDELKILLKQAEKVQDYAFIARVLEQLSYASFYLKKDEEFERILSNYISTPEIDIKENTLVNVAVGTLYSYSSTREGVDRRKTLDYLNKALRKMEDYGEALALKLELFMMDYDFALTAEAKEKAKQNASNVFDYINSASTSIAAVETIRRFDRILASKMKTKYIKLLFEVFPQQIQAMRAIAEKAVQPNYPTS